MPTRAPIPPQSASAPAPAPPQPDLAASRPLLWLASRARPVHLVLGVALVLAFLGTGQYMDLRHDHLRGMDDATRLLFRSNHIYLLLAALLNLALGLYLAPRAARWAQAAQVLGSAAIVLASVLFLAAFFVEPLGAGLERPLTRPAVYAAFDGSLLHLLAAFRLPARRPRRTSPA